MFLDAYKRNWLETEGYSFEDKMIDDLSVSCDRGNGETSSRDERLRILTTAPLVCNKINQKAMEEEEEEEEETERKPDPLHQLILHFSRTALTEKT